MQRSREYLIADAVLSGRPIPAFPDLKELAGQLQLDETRREMKLCESCPRNFTRPIGSKQKNCDHCEHDRRRYH